jgi:hypothetical protein
VARLRRRQPRHAHGRGDLPIQRAGQRRTGALRRVEAKLAAAQPQCLLHHLRQGGADARGHAEDALPRWVLVGGAAHLGVVAPVMGGHALGRGDDADAVRGVGAVDRRQQVVGRQRRFREQENVRRVAGRVARQRRRCGEPAGVPPHRLDDRDLVEAGHGAQVQPDLLRGDGQVAGGAGVARRHIAAGQVVVDGLGDADHPERCSVRGRGRREFAHRRHRAVAADQTECVDLRVQQPRHERRQLGVGGAIAAAAQRRGRLLRQARKLGGGCRREIDPIAAHQPSQAVARAPQATATGQRLPRRDQRGQRGVDDRGGAAALGDECVHWRLRDWRLRDWRLRD